ncbi:MAG: long-chain acyl-CoA synthetase [Cellvibrionaceae bacterium]|jgi:long-chain acyl-CoA synthetase
MDQYNTISELFANVCQRYHDLPAFTCLGETITFGELDVMTRDFASYLQHHTTLAPGDRLAVQLPNLLQYPVVLYGALRAGIVIVNTNPLYTGRELEHQLHDSGAKVLVVLANLSAAAEEVIDKTDIQHVIVTEVGDMYGFPKRHIVNGVLRYVKKEVPDCHFPSTVKFRRALQLGRRDVFHDVIRDSGDIAFLQYTGGTTGIAKGAMLSQANLMSDMSQILTFLGDSLQEGGEKFLAPLPLYNIYGFTMHCMVLFAIGCQNVLIPNPRDIDNVVKTFKKNKLTGMVGLNTLFVALTRHPSFKQLDFSSLRITTSGGMALVEATAKKWYELTGTKIVEGYGLTETSPVVTSNNPKNPLTGTIGLALPETELKVIDADGHSLSAGEAGELCVRGPQVMLGYWQQPEATAKVITENGWLLTGDIATIDERGYVRIVDRKKDMIIVSGFNVYPNEVESILVSHPEIIEAAVIGVADDSSGEAVKAFIVRTEDSDIEDAEVKAYCKKSLTAYKVPCLYEFRSELPKSNVGKVLRRELRA